MKATPPISDFTRGELSPRMEGRSDTQAFFQGVSTLENMIVLPQGGVEKRPGTQYFAQTADMAKRSRLIPFIIDEHTPYIVELADGAVRVVKRSSSTRTLLNTKHSILLDVAPSEDWTVGSKLTGVSSGATCRVMARTSSLVYEISEPSGAFTDGEVLRGYDATGTQRDADQGSNYPQVSTSAGSPVYLVGGASFYDEDELYHIKYVQVAGRLVMVHENHPPQILTRIVDTGWTLAVQDIGIPAFQSTNTLREKSDNVINPRRITDLVPGGAVIYQVGTVVNAGGTFYRAIDNVTQSTAPASEGSKWQAITGSPVVDPFADGSYPTAIAYFQDRLVYGGPSNRIWGSGTGQYEYFMVGPSDADPWSYEFLSERQEKVQWIAAREVLVVGTTGGETVVLGGQTGITPSAVIARRQTTIGSANLQGKLINENIVFVQKGGRKLREYFYQNELQAYRAQDLTYFSDHITGTGLREFGFQSDPDPILWCVRSDGQLAGVTYDKGREIAGWHRQITDGAIESFAVILADGEDEVWAVVRRTVGGSTVRYLEYFAPRSELLQTRKVFVDASVTRDGGAAKIMSAATAANPVEVTVAGHGLTNGDAVRITNVEGMTELEGRVFFITSTGANTFTLDNEDGTGRAPATAGHVTPVYAQVTGLSHLEGKEVAIAVDGGPHARRTVASGTVTLDAGTYGNVIHVGLPYKARIRTMNILAAAPDAKRGRVNKVRIRFIESTQAKAGANDETLTELIFRQPTTPYGQVAELFTGEKEVETSGRYSSDQRVIIESDQPTPLTVAVILPEIGMYAGGQ